MHKKLAGYFFLSLFSFGFFTIVLHASAQTSQTALLPVLADQANTPPTPTIYVKTEKAPQPKAIKEIPSPTPTIYIAPREDEPVVLADKAVSTDDVKKVVVKPTAVVTLAPQPTQLPTQVPTQTPQPVVVASVSAGNLDALFAKYSGDFGINNDELKRIARCESGFNTNSDTGVYAGMFQFNTSTWISTRNAMGLDPNPELRKNSEEAIRTAAFKIKSGGRAAWPNC